MLSLRCFFRCSCLILLTLDNLLILLITAAATVLCSRATALQICSFTYMWDVSSCSQRPWKIFSTHRASYFIRRLHTGPVPSYSLSVSNRCCVLPSLHLPPQKQDAESLSFLYNITTPLVTPTQGWWMLTGAIWFKVWYKRWNVNGFLFFFFNK